MAALDQKTVDRLVREFSDRWQSLPKPAHPFVLMLAGFQGAGKTTVLRLVAEELPIAVIPMDELRGRQISWGGEPYTEPFDQVTDMARADLIELALSRGLNLTCDETWRAEKIKLMRDLLRNDHPSYGSLTVLLQTSEAELIRRLDSRQKPEGFYNASAKNMLGFKKAFGEFDPKDFDLVFDTEQTNPKAIAEQVLKELQQRF